MLSFAFSCHDNEELTKVEDINDPPKIVVSYQSFFAGLKMKMVAILKFNLPHLQVNMETIS